MPTVSDYILTSLVGRNEDVFPSIMKLYVSENSEIADVTYGSGRFWNRIDTSKYQLSKYDIENGVDCRDLPILDDVMDAVILDPPYIYNPKRTIKESIASTYNINKTSIDLSTIEKVLQLYYDSMVEAWRVLKKGGVLVVKCQDQIQSNKQCWMHIDIQKFALENGFVAEDFFVLVQNTIPARRWAHQIHARKNHSYFWVFKKKQRVNDVKS